MPSDLFLLEPFLFIFLFHGPFKISSLSIFFVPWFYIVEYEISICRVRFCEDSVGRLVTGYHTMYPP